MEIDLFENQYWFTVQDAKARDGRICAWPKRPFKAVLTSTRPIFIAKAFYCVPNEQPVMHMLS